MFFVGSSRLECGSFIDINFTAIAWLWHRLNSTLLSQLSMYAETAARDSLEQVISEALVHAGSDKSDVRGVCLGVSGVNHPSDQKKIENWIRC